MTFRDVPHFGEMNQIQILICNVGYRPIVLIGFRALGQASTFSMGIDDEPAAALGISDQRFPKKIEPGETLKIHPLAINALKHNQTDPHDEKVQFDPWRLFVLEDSFGRWHPLEVEDVLRELHIGNNWRYYRGISKLRRAISRRLFMRRVKGRFRHL
jgi:hypothetical protein